MPLIHYPPPSPSPPGTRYDTDDPPAPGVLGGWLPELQGECRPGCENLPRDVTINTNYGRVNGFYVYLYDGPREEEAIQ